MRGKILRIAVLLSALPILGTLAGCGLFPGNGPAGVDILNAADSPSLPYGFVRITSEVTRILARTAPRLVGEFPDKRPPKDIRFGIGDIVTVTIFEASSGGLFIPAEAGVRPGNFVTIPNQAVDIQGNISVPFAGNIRAKGRTPVEVQQAVVDALKNRAIEPQVIVSTVDQRTSLITVLGDVGRPGRLPANAAGERLLDVISRAGGAASPGPDEWVMLERKGRRGIAPFGALLTEPGNNIWAHPDDTVYLYRDAQTFLAFGATGQQQQIPFGGVWRLSLAEAVAKAGGLIDIQADPAAVFLYRGETREVAEALGVDIARFNGPIVPVLYNINFRDPAGYFLATNIDMRNKDVIYVSNSVSVEATKVMTFIQNVNSTVSGPINTATQYYTLKNIINNPGSSAVITGVSPTPPPAP